MPVAAVLAGDHIASLEPAIVVEFLPMGLVSAECSQSARVCMPCARVRMQCARECMQVVPLLA